MRFQRPHIMPSNNHPNCLAVMLSTATLVRPDKALGLQPLVPKTKAIAILVQDLQPIPVPVHKYKQRCRKWIEP
jgi:hypothetical protein